MDKIWVVVYNKDKNFSYVKYFNTEFEKDKYKRKIKYVPSLILIEDSTDINWNYS